MVKVARQFNIAQLRAVKMVLFDIDGTLTDGRIIIDSTGVETKFFDVRDGAGITILQYAGIKVALLTGRNSPVVDFRAKELKIPPALVKQGAKVKLPVFEQLLAENGLQSSEVAFVGDDLIDLPVLERAGIACCVGNAHPDVLKICHLIAEAPGGRGAGREISEYLLKERADGSWERGMDRYWGKVIQ